MTIESRQLDALSRQQVKDGISANSTDNTPHLSRYRLTLPHFGYAEPESDHVHFPEPCIYMQAKQTNGITSELQINLALLSQGFAAILTKPMESIS